MYPIPPPPPFFFKSIRITVYLADLFFAMHVAFLNTLYVWSVHLAPPFFFFFFDYLDHGASCIQAHLFFVV